jgi:hypothetical protein
VSQLSQTFLLTPDLQGKALHVNFWLDVTTPAPTPNAAIRCGVACAAPTPVYPRITVIGSSSRLIAQVSLLPRRTRVWSGLRLPLPACAVRPACPAERLTLRLIVPPQPAGVSVVLYVDDIHLGP